MSEANTSQATPLPPVGKHTETLERPQRGRARESEHERARELQNRTTPRNPKTSRGPRRLSKSSTGDKKSPDVVAPDLKKIKREPETKPEAKPDTDMPDFGAERTQATTATHPDLSSSSANAKPTPLPS